MLKKQEITPDVFWREFEEKTNEKILSRALGKYISGWDEFDNKRWGGIWGLVIMTSGGFRFHSFPQYSWIDSFTHFMEKESPKEKTIFIEQEKIVKTEIIKETKWWKKIFSASPPLFVIQYTDEAGNKKRLTFEAEFGNF